MGLQESWRKNWRLFHLKLIFFIIPAVDKINQSQQFNRLFLQAFSNNVFILPVKILGKLEDCEKQIIGSFIYR